MSLNVKHPLYAQFLEDWVLCRDCYRGERIVKDKGKIYLPATGGMVADGAGTPGTDGELAYQAYKQRAIFHEFFADAVETYIGMMWARSPVIELPGALQDYLEKATITGENVEQLLRRINENQLVTGRLGLLADLPENPPTDMTLPYIALYDVEHVINWDEGKREDSKDTLNMVVLDETEFERLADGFTWEKVEKYRVLQYGDLLKDEEGTGEKYLNGLFRRSASYAADQMVEPSIRGRSPEEIPFVFINSKDCLPQPDDPPLLGLARLALAIYRGEADFRQSLFMQGQDTLVVIGGPNDGKYRLGAGSCINLKSGGDAKFIGVDAAGLDQQRQAIEADKALAGQKSGALIDTRSKAKESGDALNTRLAAQTATLTQIALAGAGGLEKILKIVATWVGANPDEVKVTPNLDFSPEVMAPKDLVDLMAAKNQGAPLSMKTIHTLMRERDITEMEYEEELAEIQEEAPLIQGGPGTVVNPADPNYDPNKDPNYDPTKDPNSPTYNDPAVAHKQALELKFGPGGKPQKGKK